MPPLAIAAPLIGAATSAIGGIAGAMGASAQGANAKALGEFEAAQYTDEAETAVGRAQRKMEEQQRKGQLTQSTLVARAAGNGLTASTGSVNILGQQIAGRNTYAALSDLAAGQDVAAGFLNQASGAKYQGDLAESVVPQEQIGAYAGAASSAFGSLGKLAGSGVMSYG